MKINLFKYLAISLSFITFHNASIAMEKGNVLNAKDIALRKHMKKHLKEEKSLKKKWSVLYCNYCTDHKPFRTALGLINHEESVHLIYKCVACHKGFSTEVKLCEHNESCSVAKMNAMGEGFMAMDLTLHQEQKENPK